MLGAHRGCIILTARTCQISPALVNQIDGAQVWATYAGYGQAGTSEVLHLAQLREQVQPAPMGGEARCAAAVDGDVAI